MFLGKAGRPAFRLGCSVESIAGGRPRSAQVKDWDGDSYAQAGKGAAPKADADRQLGRNLLAERKS